MGRFPAFSSWFLLGLLLIQCFSSVYGADDDNDNSSDPSVVILFMFFGLGIGILVMQVLSIAGEGIPYTVVVFLLGVAFSAATGDSGTFGESIAQWVQIDADLVLFVFLPPLIFGEAMSLNWYHVKGALSPSMLLAGPGVLIGAFAMGAITKVILPYNWNWNLAMTFGSILSATDPVAVVALLKSASASPKLTMTIVGESLLNDGTAMVLFTVFFNALNGMHYTAGKVIEFFLAAAIGSVALGIGFGIVAVRWLRSANRPLKETDVTIQIAVTICCAYLCFFTAQYSLEISGVLACCGAGIMLAWLAPPIILSHETMHNVWGMIEWTLNTLIFLLAGLIIGHRVLGKVSVADWFLVLALYVILMGIRIAIMAIFFPWLRKLGHGCTRNEAIFMSYAGLRGALGMTLALIVEKGAPSDIDEETSRLFFYVGGIAALTLVINATTAKQLLVYLGLLGSDTDEKALVTSQIKKKLRRRMDKVVVKMAEEFAFSENDMDEVRMSCTLLAEMNMHDLYRDTDRMSNLLADVAYAQSAAAGKHDPSAAVYGMHSNLPAPASVSRIEAIQVTEMNSAGASSPKVNASAPSSPSHNPSTKPVTADLDDGSEAQSPMNPATAMINDDDEDSHSVASAGRRHKKSGSFAYDNQQNLAGGLEHRLSRSYNANQSRTRSFSFGARKRSDSQSPLVRADRLSRLLGSNRGNVMMPELVAYVRAIFLEIVRVKYWQQIEGGKLPRLSHSAQFLLYSVEVGLDQVSEVLGATRDWSCIEADINYNPYVLRFLICLERYLPSGLAKLVSFQVGKIMARNEKRAVYMLTSFIEAHEHAQRKIHSFLSIHDEDDEDGDVTETPTSPEEAKVLSESRAAVEKAKRILSEMNKDTITAIRSKQAARLVLAKQAEMVKNMVQEGLLTTTHAEEFLEEISHDTAKIERERNRMYKQHAAQAGKQRDIERRSLFDSSPMRQSNTAREPLVPVVRNSSTV